MYIDLYLLHYLPERFMADEQRSPELMGILPIDLSENWYSPVFTLHQSGILQVSGDHRLLERLEHSDRRWQLLLEYLHDEARSGYERMLHMLGYSADGSDDMLPTLYRAIAHMLLSRPDALLLEQGTQMALALWNMSDLYPFTDQLSSYQVWPYLSEGSIRDGDMAVSVYKVHL
jgi:hypothetical protein